MTSSSPDNCRSADFKNRKSSCDLSKDLVTKSGTLVALDYCDNSIKQFVSTRLRENEAKDLTEQDGFNQ